MPANDILLESFSRNSGEWNIEEASYQGGGEDKKTVVFLVFQSKQQWGGAVPHIQDKGGRRKNILEFPYTDGQTLDDLGRKGNHFEIEILFFGPLYRNGLNSLLQQADVPQPGTLMHPVRGPVTCALVDYSLEFSENTRNAVLMRALFEEHDFSAVSLSITPVVKTTAGALAVAIAALQAIGQAVVAIKIALKLAASIKADILQTIDTYKDYFDSFTADANSLANGSTSNNLGPNGSFGFPGVTTINTGGLLQPVSASSSGVAAVPSTTSTGGVGGTATLPGGYVLVGQRVPTVISPNDPFANISGAILNPTTAEALSITQMSQRADIFRQMGQALVAKMEAANGGLGSLQMRDIILVVIQAAIAAQSVIEALQASSSSRLVSYTVPATLVMSLREVAFANGLSPDDAAQILILNPSLESTNLIPGGTVLQVAKPV